MVSQNRLRAADPLPEHGQFRRESSNMPNLPRSLQVTTLISILVALGLILASCSEDPELIGTDMESQQAPPFTLIDHRGETVQLSDLRGKAVAMTFIFTNCPDVCPLIINRMSMAYEQVPDDKKDDIAMVAITVDPERDDRGSLQQYSESFQADPAGWKFLRGSTEEIESVTGDFKYSFHLDEEGNAVHPTTMYLVDEAHNVRAYHKMSTSEAPMDQERIMDEIEYLLKDR
jgi:protein SCO1